MTEPTDNTMTPDQFGEGFDAWISGATLAQKSVDIYANPGLFAEYEQLERELEVARAEAGADEVSMEDSRVADIEERMVAVYERWMASKSTWTVRAVPEADAKELSERYPDMSVPEEPPADADSEAKSKYKADLAKFEERSDGRNYAILERVILKIEYPDGRVAEAKLADDGVSVEEPVITAAQLAKLRARLGQLQFIKLIGASKLAAVSEPVIPAPFLRSSSQTAQT